MIEIPGPDDKSVYTISRITQEIKFLLEGHYPSIWIKGEISNFKSYPSGKYFSLKDDNAVISAVMFKSAFKGLKFEPEDGQEVICLGRISVYEKRGNYQVIIDEIHPVGKGSLQLAFEQLKAKLYKEGLFDLPKKPIPAFPMNIGVITSPSGAAIRDILHITKRRAPFMNVYIIPSLVQGEIAKKSIIKAIKLVERMPFLELLIIGRGGGSIEDLWCFNEELVARAIAACPITTISAVGHEIDFTISDFVADHRASTPSAAAEIITARHVELMEWIAGVEQMLDSSVLNIIQRKKDRLASFTEDRLFNRVRDYIERNKLLLDDIYLKLDHSIMNYITSSKNRVQVAAGKLSALNPLDILSRGYSVTKKIEDNTIVNSSNQLTKGDKVEIMFSRGKAIADITSLT